MAGSKFLPLKRLLDSSSAKVVNIIGLMSGTSADGIDACLVQFRRERKKLQWSLLSTLSLPFKSSLKERILRTASLEGTVEDACLLDRDLGIQYGQAVKRLIRKSGVQSSDIVAVASHGQTIRHFPPHGRCKGATMQIGQSAIIAQESALPVVSDFRVADMAANGHGAPLVPAADKLLFAKKGKWIALQNIGGMANVTLLPPVEKNEAVVAFDTGPGNALIDLAVLEMSKGQQSYDKGGQIAKRGKIIPSLLNWLEKIPYLSEKPPKSTGRELFGEELFRKMLQRAAVKKAKAEDLVSTLTEFTVSTILSAYKDHLPVEPEEVYVAGGGARNRTLLRGLKQGLTVPVAPLGDRQLADFREALCFATLGYLFLLGKPGAEREATGAKNEAILGKLSLPPQWVVKK